MARKIILKEDGLNGSGTAPDGYKYIGDDAGTVSQKVGATVSAIGGGVSEWTETIVNISSSQLLNLGTSDISLLPNAGINMYYEIDKIILEYTDNGIGYTPESPSYPVIEVNSNAYSIITNVVAGDTRVYIIRDFSITFAPSSQEIVPQMNQLNGNCSIKMGGGPGTLQNGNGTLRVKLYHKTVTFGA